MLYQIPPEPHDSANIAVACLSYLSLFGVTAPLSGFSTDDQIGGLVWGGVGMRVSCWIGFLSGTVSMQCGDAISVKTCYSMEPCQPTMESSITQSAAGQSPLSLSLDWNIHRLI